jgi:superfamily II DNA/RNA helicase
MEALNLVINYDYPDCQERQFLSLEDVVNKAHQTYLKRISNLSRKGCAVTFFTAKNYNFVKSVVETLNKEGQVGYQQY